MFHAVDLHTDSLVDARLSSDKGLDGPVKIAKFHLTGDSFQAFKASLTKEDYVLVESCANAFWFYDEIKDLVKECYVLDVNKFKNGNNKTDKIDAKKLVKRLAYYVIAHGDDSDLPLVYVPSKEVRELRGLFSTYRLNKKTMTQFKNRIHSILKQNGIPLGKKEIFGPAFQDELAKLPIEGTWRLQIETLFRQYEAVEKETAKVKKLIYTLGYRLFPRETEILLSIRGFSPLTAFALMSDVVDVSRFKSVKKFCAYLRTAPKVRGSNETVKIGSTNRYSRSLTCSLLTQSVQHFACAGQHLEAFYARVKIGKKPGVYRMALIRKVLVCAYHMLKRNTLFYWTDSGLYQDKLRELERIGMSEEAVITTTAA